MRYFDYNADEMLIGRYSPSLWRNYGLWRKDEFYLTEIRNMRTRKCADLYVCSIIR